VDLAGGGHLDGTQSCARRLLPGQLLVSLVGQAVLANESVALCLDHAYLRRWGRGQSRLGVTNLLLEQVTPLGDHLELRLEVLLSGSPTVIEERAGDPVREHR